MTRAERGEGRRSRVAALSQRLPLGRGARFARRLAGEPPVTFADCAALPAWTWLGPSALAQAPLVAGLLYHRDAIDRELSGTKLAALAALVGSDVFDAVCGEDLEIGVIDAPLPPSARLEAQGRALLDASLPRALRPCDVDDAPCARPIAAAAYRVLSKAA